MYYIITKSKISRINFSKITRYANKEEDHRKLNKLEQQNEMDISSVVKEKWVKYSNYS